jgi:prevent-host-death family protein
VKKIAVSAFKRNCLTIIDEILVKHETVIITKRGKPVAKLVPVNAEPDDVYNFLAGKGAIVGDVVSPTLSPREWRKLA